MCTRLALLCAAWAAAAAEAAAVATEAEPTPAAASAAAKPHILFIVADDHGFHDCSFTGSRVHTPTIDRLRSQGIALEQYWPGGCAHLLAARPQGRSRGDALPIVFPFS